MKMHVSVLCGREKIILIHGCLKYSDLWNVT